MSAFAGVSLLAYPAFGALLPWLMRPRVEKPTTEWRIIHSATYIVFIYFQFLQYFLATVGWSFTVHGYRISYEIKADSSIIFPLGLAAILYAYLTRNSINFVKLCMSLVASNVAMILAICLRRTGWGSSWTPKEWQPLWKDGAISVLGFGACLQAIDIYVMHILYNKVSKHTTNIILRVALPLLIALIIDSIGFSLIVTFYKTQNLGYFSELSSQLPTKFASGSIYAFWISAYFYYFDVHSVPNLLTHATKFKRSGVKISLTAPVDCDRSLYTMPERGSKDAARGVPEKQELTPETHERQQGGFVAALGKPDDIKPRQIITEGVVAFRRNIHDLFNDHPNEWVAYYGDEFIGVASTRTEIYKLVQERNLNRRDVLIRFIDKDSLNDIGVYDSSANTLN